MSQEVVVGGTRYVPADSLPPRITGKRAVVVVDRGWIWAGDVEEKDDHLILTRAVWVFSWSDIGFDGVIKDPKSASVKIRPLPYPVQIPRGSEIFRVPVSDDWGF